MRAADNAPVPASNLSRKLLIEAGQRVLVLNPPAAYIESLLPLPEGVEAVPLRNGRGDSRMSGRAGGAGDGAPRSQRQAPGDARR